MWAVVRAERPRSWTTGAPVRQASVLVAAAVMTTTTTAEATDGVGAGGRSSRPGGEATAPDGAGKGRHVTVLSFS
eukprot:CAMPEP_0181352114 /NCGR_PEP_ID=MMETSP1106-20121128/2136_1 /TAXON_ID=81844 /ORGANISM="Mantoniella antarctica, Strain SL-175" /LENGTH=74 /DNA_ID=CAMNT_0023464651 /DNA_START=221 /DNA_END=442 /DNA_ORIENTATION=+